MRGIHLLLLAGATALPAAAADTYRWIDPASGRTVLSDQPPPANVRFSKLPGASAATAGDELPPALRSAVRDFPVMLYTGKDCGEPCDEGRALLVGRGVPFGEKRMHFAEDFDAVEILAGVRGVPVLTVGRERHVGFQPDDWNQTLDLAGYPNRPWPGYQPPAPPPAPPTAPPAAEVAPGNGEPAATGQ